jgi:hypothetical protein
MLCFSSQGKRRQLKSAFQQITRDYRAQPLHCQNIKKNLKERYNIEENCFHVHMLKTSLLCQEIILYIPPKLQPNDGN